MLTFIRRLLPHWKEMEYVRTIQSYNLDVVALAHMVVSLDDNHVPIQNHHPNHVQCSTDTIA
jgi:hypothetical protein